MSTVSSWNARLHMLLKIIYLMQKTTNWKGYFCENKQLLNLHIDLQLSILNYEKINISLLFKTA